MSRLMLAALTVDDITAIVAVGRGAQTDRQARVPAGTMQTLARMGLMTKTGGGYVATDEAQTLAKLWLQRKLAERKKKGRR